MLSEYDSSSDDEIFRSLRPQASDNIKVDEKLLKHEFESLNEFLDPNFLELVNKENAIINEPEPNFETVKPKVEKPRHRFEFFFYTPQVKPVKVRAPKIYIGKPSQLGNNQNEKQIGDKRSRSGSVESSESSTETKSKMSKPELIQLIESTIHSHDIYAIKTNTEIVRDTCLRNVISVSELMKYLKRIGIHEQLLNLVLADEDFHIDEFLTFEPSQTSFSVPTSVPNSSMPGSSVPNSSVPGSSNFASPVSSPPGSPMKKSQYAPPVNGYVPLLKLKFFSQIAGKLPMEPKEISQLVTITMLCLADCHLTDPKHILVAVENLQSLTELYSPNTDLIKLFERILSALNNEQLLLDVVQKLFILVIFKNHNFLKLRTVLAMYIFSSQPDLTFYKSQLDMPTFNSYITSSTIKALNRLNANTLQLKNLLFDLDSASDLKILPAEVLQHHPKIATTSLYLKIFCLHHLIINLNPPKDRQKRQKLDSHNSTTIRDSLRKLHLNYLPRDLPIELNTSLTFMQLKEKLLLLNNLYP